MKMTTYRKLAGENTEITVCNGKIRLLLDGCFPKMPANIKDKLSDICNEKGIYITMYPDSSFAVYKASLIDFDIGEDTIEDMLNSFLNEMEELFELPVGESCTSSSWHAGHSESGYDSFMSEEEQRLVAE